MPIAFDASEDYGYENTTSRTLSFTAGAGSNRKMLVGVGLDGGADTINAVSFDAVGFFANLVGKIADGGGVPGYTYLFWLDSPNAGTHNIVVTSSASQIMRVSAVAYAGVASGAPTPSDTDNTGTGPNVTLTPGVANSWIVGYGMEHNNGSPTITDSFVTSYREGVTYNIMADTGVIAGTPATTVGFANGGDFGMVAVVLTPFTGADPDLNAVAGQPLGRGVGVISA